MYGNKTGKQTYRLTPVIVASIVTSLALVTFISVVGPASTAPSNFVQLEPIGAITSHARVVPGSQLSMSMAEMPTVTMTATAHDGPLIYKVGTDCFALYNRHPMRIPAIVLTNRTNTALMPWPC